jgi:ubiquinone/menaquinone biosynthesis C-methylase UbiE
MSTSKSTIKEYNKNYKKWLNEKGMGHSHLEKPAMYSALGNVKDKRILCLGCGAGEECGHLKSLGAKEVIGVDISKGLINEAKKKFPKIEFKVMDMEKLKFENSSFDLVYSSLVLHYVKDWTKVLKEIRRILKNSGECLFSTHNPVYWSAEKNDDKKNKSRILGYKKDKKTEKYEFYGNYLNIRKINDIWFENFKVEYYSKPFSQMIKEIIKSKLEIVDCIEPKSIKSTKKINFDFWKRSEKIPLFIIFKLKKNKIS